MKSIDYEKNFCSLLAEPVNIAFFMAEGFSDTLLLSPVSRSIYNFSTGYYERSGGDAPTFEVLEDEFPNYEFIADVQASPDWLLEKLRERYTRTLVQEIIRDAAKTTTEDAKEALTYLKNMTSAVDDVVSSHRHIYTSNDFPQRLENYWEDIQKGRFKGATTGFQEVDDFMGGLRPGSLTFLLARPERLKTWTLLNTFVAQAKAGWKPVFFTLELSENEIFRRIACLISKFSYWKFERGEVVMDELNIVQEALDRFRSYNHYVVQPELDQRSVAQLVSQADQLGANSILIDQLSFIEAKRSFPGQYHLEVADIVKDLKLSASKLTRPRPVFVSAQLNREAAKQKQMADIAYAAQSDYIGQASDTCFALYQSKDMKTQNQIELGIIKGRNHSASSWILEYDLYSRTSFKVWEEVT